MGRISQGETPALAILHKNIDILPSEKLQAFIGGKLKGNNHYIGRNPFQLVYAARQGFNFNILDRPDFATLDHQIRQRGSAAKQCHARSLFEFRQCVFVMAAEIDCSLYDFALASATGAVATAIGKRKTLA